MLNGIRRKYRQMKSKSINDIKLLNLIFETYYEKYINEEKEQRDTKNYIPIDIKLISKKLNVEPNLVFGRLYYDLDFRYRYEQNDSVKSKVHLFSLSVGNDKHCINFPYLTSILSNMRDSNKKFIYVTSISVLSLIISLSSFIVSVLKSK